LLTIQAPTIGRSTSLAEQLPPTDQQTIAQLLRRIINGLNGLVDRQVQLVKQELKEDLWAALGAAKTLGIGAGIAAAGGLVLLNVLVLIIILGLNEIGGWLLGTPGKFLGWVVMLLLLVATFFLAYRFVMRGIKEIQISPLDDTRETVREDIDWVRQLLTRNGK
jgi:pilus assembly protein TadC